MVARDAGAAPPSSLPVPASPAPVAASDSPAPDGAELLDFLIIGSGFGGSVSALRLSEKGHRVVVLEAGRRFAPQDFPRSNWRLDRFLWMPALGFYGIQRIAPFRDVLVLAGAGVGGGSLVYANTLLEPPPSFFQDPRWGRMADWKALLAPHYGEARRMLGATPCHYLGPSDQELRTIASEMGREETFHQPTVAVYFGQPGQSAPDPYFGGEGPPRTGCTLCGGCMTGCRVGAKNTLDRNYLYLAEKRGARVEPMTTVTRIRPLPGGGFAVESRRTDALLGGGRRVWKARNVVLAAGVLGTTTLLLRAREQGDLPHLSPALGEGVRTNSEALLGSISRRQEVDQSRGIAITSGFWPTPDTHVEVVRYGRGHDAMGRLGTFLVDGSGSRWRRPLRWLGLALTRPRDLLRLLRPWGWAQATTILLVMQNVENRMRLVLRRRWSWPFRKTLDSRRAEGAARPPAFIPAGHLVARRMAERTNGVALGSVTESLLDVPMTAHILGGCPMGESATDGVIDRDHQVFGYPGLYICDGSAISGNLGVNPALTICALTELAMSKIPPFPVIVMKSGRRTNWAAGLVVLALLVGAAGPARALDPGKRLADCPIEIWRVRDGLPGGWVREIVQTDDGYLWVGSFGGLVRYDGTRMTALHSQDRYRRLADVNDMAVGADGRLWVIPSYGGPICIRGREEVENCLPEVAPLQANTRLLFAARDGQAMFMAGRLELYRYEAGKTVLLSRYADSPWKRIFAITRDGQGRLWLGTDVGLFLGVSPGPGQGDHLSFVKAPGAAGQIAGPVQALLRAKNGALLIATPEKLGHLQGDQLSVASTSDGYLGGMVGAMLEDREGSLWIAGRSGLSRRTAKGFEHFGKPDGLPDQEFTSLHEDLEGGLWVGMRSGGLAQITDRSLDTRQGPSVLRGQTVYSVTEDRGGALWFGTPDGLVRWKDGDTRVFGPSDGLESAHVSSVRATADGSVWVGTELGLFRYSGGKFDRALDEKHPISAMWVDRAGTLWVGGEGRLGQIVGRQPLKWIQTEPGTTWETIRAIDEDDQGSVWVAVIGGLARVDRSQGSPRLVRANFDNGQRLPSARSFFRDPDGTLWMGTNGGLLRRRQGAFRLFAAAEGLVGEQIYQVIGDQIGFLWMGTSRGLFRVARADLEALAEGRRSEVSPAWFDTSDERRDLTVTNVRQPGVWQARDGRLWFGFDQGVLVIDPRQPHVNNLPPRITIEEALVDGRRAIAGGANRFPAGDGNLEFHFAALTLIEPRKVQLRYRLEGFDPAWQDAGGRREARYVRVPPGQYHFRVQGANADGVWNVAGATIPLHIAPHFYRTVWFYGLCLLAMGSLAWLLYRSRMDRLRRDYLAAFTERSRVARELHDTLLQSMSAVAMHLRGVRRKVEPVSANASRELETIENMVTLSLEETRRFVWNLREQAVGSGDLGRALSQLAERITAGRSPRAEVTVRGEVVPVPNTVQSDLFRIAQEAIANAVKHAEARRIEVVLEYAGRGVKLRISDDGKGFDPRTAQGASAGHFGLVGMRERAARLGKFNLDTRPGNGTTVTVTLESAGQERDEQQGAPGLPERRESS